MQDDHVERRALETLLEREIGPEAKEAVMTAGQQLREEGRQEGREAGRQEGREEGRQEGECALLLRMLRRRFGAAVDAAIEQRVAAASINQIDAWADRAFSAATLSELFADGR
jgi:predicted transposase YdaD